MDKSWDSKNNFEIPSSARCLPGTSKSPSEPAITATGTNPQAAGPIMPTLPGASPPTSKAKPSSGIAVGTPKCKISSKAKPSVQENTKSSKTKVKSSENKYVGKAKPNREVDNTSKAKPRSDSKSKSVDSRIDKLEDMLSVLMERIPAPAQLALAPQTFSSPVDKNTEPLSVGRLTSGEGLLADDFYDGSESPGSELLYDTDDVGSMGRAVGSVPTTAGKGQDSIPMIAAKFAMPSGIGAPLHDDIAQSMTYLMSNKLEEKSLDEAAEKYLSPENCELLDTPRVNTIIWENLRSATRNKDLKIQYIQKSLTKGLCAFARSLNPATMTQEQHDALALLCNANYGLNSMRKNLIKPDLNPLFHHLCRPTYPVTKHLFGEDLGRQVKELQEQQKATAGVMNTRNQPQDRHQRSYHPYRKVTDYAKHTMKRAGWFPNQDQGNSSSRMYGNSERPFLGQRQNSNFKKGNSKQQASHTYTPTAANRGKQSYHRKK
ncbi:uncharacterized protein LOC105444406 [Strongylocentrotus purpuratus]|uniref:Uncharacterized protein n=1 Tax=Strongylocentrotus purpuratus TaxID=7668 RepID=A0A7M7HQ39_STRPU|nr:uncharacterized protein LOC105444406 [Strongylocentrotus purpuratus]